MATLSEQIITVNNLGRSNLAEKGINLDANTTTYDIMSAISEITGGISYANITYNEDNTIVLTDKQGIEHTMTCTYEDGKLININYDDKLIALTYDGDVLVSIGATTIDINSTPTSVEIDDNGIMNLGSSIDEQGILTL